MKSIPFGVGKLLEGAIARVRRLVLIRGLALVGIVWVLGVAAVMAIDSRIVIFDDRIRFAMTAAVWLLAVAAAVFAVVRPLRRKLDFRKMAGILDARHPEHEERLMTLVELSERDAATAGFSASLFGVVCDLAERDAAKVDLALEFPLSGAGRRFGLFALLALMLGVGIVASPNLVGRLFVRAVAPWTDIGNLFANDITVTPGDIVTLSGSVIRIEATPSARLPTTNYQLPSYAIRLSRRTRRGWTEETTEPMANGVYETTADLNEREWRYRVTAGPAVTRYYYVRVSEMPKYDLFQATVRYPDYTGLVPIVFTNDGVTAIKAVAGSRVKFDVKVSNPGTVVDFRIGDEPVRDYTMVSNRTTNWKLDLVNADGFRAEKGCHPLTSVIDQPPTVVIEKPTGTLRLPSHAKIPVEVTATDDIAVTSAYLRVSIDGEEWEPHFRGQLDLGRDRRFVRQVADVDLSLYNLVFAKNIRFDVVVSDACPPEFGGPHSATSMPFTVQFAENEANYEMQALKQEVSEARRDIDEARRRLNDAQNLARQVRDELRRNEKPTENAERNSERLAHELTEAEKRIEELRNAFRTDERFAPLTRPMDRLMDESLKPALETVEKAQFREKNERAEDVDKAIPEMAKSVQELDELSKRLTERAEKVDALEKAKDLAARQEALAKAAQEILAEQPTDTAKLEAWKRLEEAATRKAEELVRQKSGPELAEARRKMETAARKMANLKRELDAAKTKAEALKREAAQKEQQQKQIAAREAQELKAAAAQQQNAEKALERKDARSAANAQQAAEAALQRARALPAVKELQHRATEAAKSAAQPQPSTSTSQALAAAAAEQSKAASTLQAAAAQRAEELAKRRVGDKAGADAKAKEAAASHQKAAAAQRDTESQLNKGAATEGVKAMQKLASEAAADAQKAPRDTAKADEALAAQREAAEALRQEQAIRAAMEKGEQTAADLEAFDRALRRMAEAKAAERTKVRNEEAERDRQRRGFADGQQRELQSAVNDQKRAAEALKNAAAHRTDEAKLRAANNTAAADAKAREADRFERQAAEAQRSAEDWMERGEALEGVKALQRQASQAARAARQTPQTAEKAAAAVAAQQAATEALQREMDIHAGIRKNELTDEDLAMLDQQNKNDSAIVQPQPSTSTSSPASAAEAAAEAMNREVEAQAAALGMRARSSSETAKGKGGETDSSTGGGDVSDEVRSLADTLKRSDSPTLFKDLFSRFGWFKIRGLSKDGLGVGDLKDVPPEYRDLVRRYFLKLAEDQP